MASFEIAYNQYIKPNEGGYANVAGDKGGETYAGIARNYHASWPGWTYIDFIKKTKGTIKNNTMFPDIQHQVDQFYRDWWNSKRFGEIQSQEVANLLFDFNVNSASTAIKTVQRLVGVTADGVMGPATIAAINKQDPSKLHSQLKAERKNLYEYLAAKDPTQQKFLTGWLARLKRFPDLSPAAKGIGLVALIGIGLIAGYFIITSNDNKQKSVSESRV